MEMNCAVVREAYNRLTLATGEKRHEAEREVVRASGSSPGSSPYVQGLETGLWAAAVHTTPRTLPQPHSIFQNLHKSQERSLMRRPRA